MAVRRSAYLKDDGVGNAATCLAIAADQQQIEIPRINAALADRLVVDPDNPWYTTDGYCLFSKDGNVLLRCLTNVQRYDIPKSCTCVDDEAFAYNTVLRHVTFPNGMTRIGDRAFIDSTLDGVIIPSSVRSIGAEAFAEGKNLTCVVISEGVVAIGDRAFAECRRLRQANIPASVTQLGNRLFEQSGIRAHGQNCGLTIAPENERYFMDDHGVLYRRDDDGLTLMAALDRASGTYAVLPDTVRIQERAFACNRALERVKFPDSLRIIGDRAFVSCKSLVQADLPEGLRSIGMEAFYHTSLSHLRLPATLEELGPASLVVNVTIEQQTVQTGVGGRGADDLYQSVLSGRLREVIIPRFNVEVSSDNPKFTLEEGFLCQHSADGETLQAVQFIGGGTVARIPREVTEIAEYALFGVENLKELHLHTDLERIGHSALNVAYPLRLVEVDDGEEDDPIRLYPAPNSSGTVAQRKAFRTGSFDLHQLVRDCDSSLSFMMPGYERTWRMLARLVNGRMLSERYQREFANTVRICLDELVRNFARTENRQGVRDLLDLGFIDGGSIAHAIEVANAAKGVACARLLLEEKRNRFPDRTFDFSL